MEDEDFEIEVLRKQHQFFGPFPYSCDQIADEGRLDALIWLMNSTPADTLKPFSRITTCEIGEEDKHFVFKIMKLDHRDRPTARQFLEDEWFNQGEKRDVSEDVKVLP